MADVAEGRTLRVVDQRAIVDALVKEWWRSQHAPPGQAVPDDSRALSPGPLA